jgi:hypothetical protein
MVSPEEQKPGSNLPAPPRPPGGGRRRGRRGGRGRRRDPLPARETAAAKAADEITPVKIKSAQETAAETAAGTVVAPEPPRPKTPPPVFKRADVSAINQAVEEARHIVESLEGTLEQMEEVLRLVEQAEHQKSADERELESLRRAMRRIQPPRARPEERPRPGD